MHERIDQIKTSGDLPDEAEYIFDQLDVFGSIHKAAADEMASTTTVGKTRRRKVVTLKYGTFHAREVVRERKTEYGQTQTVLSAELARLVAPGCRYGYDLVAHVGLESFLFGRRLEEIQKNLQGGSPSIYLPTSSLDELRRRFLFYLGQLHRQAAPAVAGHWRSPWFLPVFSVSNGLAVRSCWRGVGILEVVELLLESRVSVD